MKIRLPKLNPITRKRLNRFKSLRRSYYSFWILVSLYALGMMADVLFNDKPLYVRYDGDSYFPILFYYPDDVFTGSGLDTRPDYKAINRSDRFSEASSNFMMFSLYGYGPHESVPAERIDVDDSVEGIIKREQLVGTVEVDNGFEIRRSVASARIFGIESDRELRGKTLSDLWRISDGLKGAVSARFANEVPLDEYRESLEIREDLKVEVSVSSFSPRARPSRSVRITIREDVSDALSESVVFRDGVVESEGSSLWGKLTESQQSLVADRVEARKEKRIQPLAMEIDGKNYEIDFEKEDVFFPFRPTGNHWMGLDSSGRDVFSRLIHALRISMNFGILLVVASMFLGIAAGAVQGYFGGKVDLIGQRSIEVWEALPFLYVMILLGSVFGQSFSLLLFVYAIFSWIGISYYMRGEFLKLRKLPFVEAAHCLGLGSRKIILRHILPNAMVPVITFFPFALVSAIGALSALDYLGFGLPAPTPSWGELFAQAQEFRYAWWLVLYPFIVLFLVGILGVFIGEGIRSAFDPRANTHYES